MRLALNMFMSLDGVVQSGGGPDEDPRGGFKYGGWQAPFLDEDSGKWIVDFLGHADAFILGRWTYELFAGYWPTGPEPFATTMNTLPKYVVSSTLDRVDWSNSTLLKGDLETEVRRLKALPGRDLQIYGATLRTETDLGALSDRLIFAVQETMQPAHASLWLRAVPSRRGEEAKEAPR